MKNILLQTERKRLETKMLQTFGEEMKDLTRELQETLADDLVTAFQNRLAVFLRIQSKQAY
jgi:hypothetical protein